MKIVREHINENYIFNRQKYLKWKRKNVTIRGVKNYPTEHNDAGAMLGQGLYTAFLSNKALAKQYGKVYFVLNAIPKNPKVFNTLNECEIWLQQNLYYKNYKNTSDFEKHTSISKEMLKMGYDGIVIKGREIVNYNPPDNVLYFENENQLIQYYEDHIK